ncbi:ribonuclease H-like domain-containing protein [Mycena sp. CBHHK59/15]|nr:ribonuclease H-like domain-containing protein [Mycena sp. CBHHK59/15]
MSGKETTQAWYWAYLIKHPDFYSKVPEVKEHGKHGDKPKVYCRAHLNADIRGNGRRTSIRVFLRPKQMRSLPSGCGKTHALKQGWMIGHTTTMLNHLKSCQLVHQSVRDKALKNPSNAGTGFSKQAWRWSSCWCKLVSHSFNNSNSYLVCSRHQHLITTIQGLYNVFGGSDNFAFPVDPRHGHGLHRSSSVVSLAPSGSISTTGTFEEKVLCLTVSGNLPFVGSRTQNGQSFVQNSYHNSNDQWRSDYTLSSTQGNNKVRAEVQSNLTGKNATIQGDGWTGINHHHLNAFMATVEHALHTVRVFQDSAERKTAKNHLTQLLAVFRTLTDEWKVVVVAVTTDASGESRKARLLFAKGHQINLIVGDYFKANMRYMVQDTCPCLNSGGSGGSGRRLQEVQSALTAVIEREMRLPPKEHNFVRGDRKAKEKYLAMVAVVKDPFFWRAISQMVRHLNPLAVACNVVQAAFCSLDTVLLAFRLLYAKYQIFLYEDNSGLHTDEEDSRVHAVLDSLEKRWKNVGREQEVFIAAVLLIPFFKNTPFSFLPILNCAGSDLTLERLNSREYFDGTGLFAGLHHYCTSEIERRRVDQNMFLDPLEALDQCGFPGVPPCPLVRLASHILLITANSASCEHLLSQFGLILTKLRNHMAPGTLTDLAEYKMHIRDEHLRRDGSSRLHCQFEARRKDDQATALPSRSSAQLPRPPVSDDEDNETQIPWAAPTATPSTSKTAFRKFIEECQQLAVEDNLTADYVDMELEHWVNKFETYRGMSLDEEMELYELLDFDANGEAEEDTVDVDDITESILLG